MRFQAGIMGGGYSDEAVALFARITTPPSEARKAAINRVITRGKAAGWWNKLDVLTVLAAADSQAATRNWIGDAYNASPQSSPTFEADHGYQGNGSSSYISTGFNPTAAVSPKFVQDSATMFAFSTTNVSNGAGVSADVGNLNSSLRRDAGAGAVNLTGTISGRANTSTTTNVINATAGTARGGYPGFVGFVRSDSATWKGYDNSGAVYQTVSFASAALSNLEFLALRAAGVGFGKNQLAAYGWGSALTDVQMLDLRNALVEYMVTVEALSRVIYLDGDSYSITNGGVGLGLSLIADTGRAVLTGGIGGDTLANEAARVATAAQEFGKSSFVFWDGSSNGYGTLSNDMALYGQIATAIPHSIIIPPVRRGIDDSGTKAAITALQSAIATAYASRTIDAQALLAAAATSPGDDADVAAGVVPSSCLIDPVNNAHLNAKGWAAIMPTLEALITSLGY